MRRAMLALTLLCLPLTAQAEIVGRADVVDGHRLRVDGVVVRLNGVAPLDPTRKCWRGRDQVSCEGLARNALRQLVQGRLVRCEEKEGFAPVFALCRVAGRDLGEAMVRAGYAIGDPQRSRQYQAAEQAARTARLGIWAADPSSPNVDRPAFQRPDAKTQIIDLSNHPARKAQREREKQQTAPKPAD